ncbi:MAG: hypothetical protein HOV83_15790 [Catenulispora sp.]|nr:hypothetical protein [Catenulispora sp.]
MRSEADGRDDRDDDGVDRDGDRDDDRDDITVFTLGDESAAREQPELHRLLRGIVDDAVSAPRTDFYPQVIKRAAVIRRRRRALRASSATAVLALAVVFGPAVARDLGVRGGMAVAEPPSAVVDMASAYPDAEPSSTELVPLEAARPANALSWPTRGDALPAQATELATSFLIERGGAARIAAGADAGSATAPKAASDATPNAVPDAASDATSNAASAAPPDLAAGAATASVTTLWAGIEDDTAVLNDDAMGAGPQAGVDAGGLGINVNGSPQRLVAQDAHKTWLFVMQGWRTGLDGAPISPAVLLIGEYTQSASESSMTVHSTPVAFAHARPGSGDDTNDTDQIAELSIWLPKSGRLLVLGAPQTKTVLYAKTGGDLIPQKTVDGVALFPRARTMAKGRFTDTVQVRDAKNVALTPPKAWTAGDYTLTGAEWRWASSEPGWVLTDADTTQVSVPVPTPKPKPLTKASETPKPSASTAQAPPSTKGADHH